MTIGTRTSREIYPGSYVHPAKRTRTVALSRVWHGDAWHCLMRFAAVGTLGTMVDLALFAAVRIGLGAPTMTANSLSYGAGIVTSYVLHRRWTYAHRPQKAVGTQFAQFALISLAALIVNNILVLTLAHSLDSLFAFSGPVDLPAKLCATSVTVGWNFLANNFWTFRNSLPATPRTIRSRPPIAPERF